MLRDYEILYIVRADLDEEQLNDAVRKVTELIQNLGGRHQNTNLWGRRRLAYEVSHQHEGHYVLTDFEIEPARVPELEATLKISDTVFRHLVVRKPPKKAAAAAPATAPAAAPAPAEGEASDGEEPVAAASVDEPVMASPLPAKEEETQL